MIHTLRIYSILFSANIFLPCLVCPVKRSIKEDDIEFMSKPNKTSGGKMVCNSALKRKIPTGRESCKLSEFLKLEITKPLKSENRSGVDDSFFGSSSVVDFHNDY